MDFKTKSNKFIFLVFVFIFVVVYALCYPFLHFKSYNIMTKLSKDNKLASSDVVVVVINDESLQQIGRWPWDRKLYLEIFDYFQKYCPDVKSMGYDGLIMETNEEIKSGDKEFFNNIGKFDKLTAGITYSYRDFPQGTNKEELLNTLKTKSHVNIIDKRTKKKENQKNEIKSFAILQKDYFKNIHSLGAVISPEDSDGYVRKTTQLVEYDGTFFPSFAFSMYQKNSGINEFILTDKYLTGYKDKKVAIKIPVHSEDDLVTSYISYYNTRKGESYSHKVYSASDIIKSYRAIKQGNKPIIDPSEFAGKTVFIGANANATALEDVSRTPISEKFPGVDIQATNYDNLISNNFVKVVPPVCDFLVCIVVFMLIFVLAATLPVTQALLSSVCVMFGCLFVAWLLYLNKIAISLITPELFIIVALGCAYSYRYVIEDAKKEKMQKAMGKYLSYDVMQNVVQNIDNIELGGKREDITVLFADIRNFTSLSETMDAGSVTNILNEYFGLLVPVVEEHNGVLNKFMGDAVLAIFGSPKKSENHALDAVRCANKMLKRVKFLQEKWLDEGKPKIEIGIGISSGEAFVGNIGTQDRLEYTVIGDTVNTASRIENYNKVYRTNFLISESTYKRVENYVDTIAIKNVAIRGKSHRITLYEVLRLVDKK